MDISYKLKTEGIDKLLRKLTDSKLHVDVGILGAQARVIHPSTSEDKNKKTVAQIGSYHEYGKPQAHIPQRSFLRWPIFDELLPTLLERFQMKYLVNLLLYDPQGFMTAIGTTALQVIDNAFDRGGTTLRSWQSLNPKYAKTKQTDQILVETKTLKNSISYRIGGE